MVSVAQRTRVGEATTGRHGERIRIVGTQGIESFELGRNPLRDWQVDFPDGLRDALGELVTAVVVVMSVIDLAVGRLREGPGGTVGSECGVKLATEWIRAGL